jgi:hypothetical protein
MTDRNGRSPKPRLVGSECNAAPVVPGPMRPAAPVPRGAILVKSSINELLRKTAARTRTFLISCEAFHDLALGTPETPSIFELLVFSNLYRVTPLLPLHPK